MLITARLPFEWTVVRASILTYCESPNACSCRGCTKTLAPAPIDQNIGSSLLAKSWNENDWISRKVRTVSVSEVKSKDPERESLGLWQRLESQWEWKESAHGITGNVVRGRTIAIFLHMIGIESPGHPQRLDEAADFLAPLPSASIQVELRTSVGIWPQAKHKTLSEMPYL